MLLLVSENAAGDLEDIYDYWRRKASVRAAGRLLDKIGERLSLLTRYPRAGISRTEFGSGTRCISAGNYVIYYRIAQQHIEILRVLHGARNQRHAFRSAQKRR